MQTSRNEEKTEALKMLNPRAKLSRFGFMANIV